MPKPVPRRCAAAALRPEIATASTDSTRRTPSRCTRPMKPVPKIAVLIDFIFNVPCGLGPPCGGWLLTNDDAVEEICGFGQALFRREQAVFMLNGEDVVVTKHSQG